MANNNADDITMEKILADIKSAGGVENVPDAALSFIYGKMKEKHLPLNKIFIGTEAEAESKFKRICINTVSAALHDVEQEQEAKPAMEKYATIKQNIKDWGLKYSEIFEGESEELARERFQKLEKHPATLRVVELANRAIERDPDDNYPHLKHSIAIYYDKSLLKDGFAWGVEKHIRINRCMEIKDLMSQYNLSYADVFGASAQAYERYIEDNIQHMSDVKKIIFHDNMHNAGVKELYDSVKLQIDQNTSLAPSKITKDTDRDSLAAIITYHQIYEPKRGINALLELLSPDIKARLSKIPFIQIMSNEPLESPLPDEGTGFKKDALSKAM